MIADEQLVLETLTSTTIMVLVAKFTWIILETSHQEAIALDG